MRGRMFTKGVLFILDNIWTPQGVQSLMSVYTVIYNEIIMFHNGLNV